MSVDFSDDVIERHNMLDLLGGMMRGSGAAHHIDSMNQFASEGIRYIIARGFQIEHRIMNERVDPSDLSPIKHINYRLHFENVHVHKPTMRGIAADSSGLVGTSGAMFPHQARELMLSYANEIYVDAKITATAYREHGAPEERTAALTNMRIGAIPCMLHTVSCNLHGLSRRQLIEKCENPADFGGYFIIRGQEYSVDCVENISINDLRITTEERATEDARIQILSRFGDWFETSYQTIIRHHQTGGITVETQFLSLSETDRPRIPFNTFMRLLCDISDREIAEHIIGDLTRDDIVTRALVALIDRAFSAKYTFGALQTETSHIDVIRIIGKQIIDISRATQERTDEITESEICSTMKQQIDSRILPHLGGAADRMRKVRYTCYAIRRMLIALLGMLPSLDRVTLHHKRMHAAGITVSKAFKTMFNQAVTIPIKSELENAFKSAEFSKVDIATAVFSAIQYDKLETYMQKNLTVTGPEVQIARHVTKSRVSSQIRYLKNDVNARAIAGNIATTNRSENKQTDHADQMRRAHPSYLGYIDLAQSADTGSKVGMTKQIAVSAIITLASSSDVLKQAIRREEADRDTFFLPEQVECTTANINARRLSRVFVNGDWIACVARDWEFVERWRGYRRRQSSVDENVPMIHPHTSIIWDIAIREVRFWVDFGRMLRPLVIVYNNIAEFDADHRRRAGGTASRELIEFKQWTRLSQNIITQFSDGVITTDDLLKRGIVEYLSSEECENMLIAQHIGFVRAARHDVCLRYTHCDIEQSIHGIVILSSPLTNHTYGIRTTYFGNQRKQSAGWPDLAYGFRHSDRKIIFQPYCEHPIVETLADRFTNPNGQNVIVGLMIHSGYNQEDSIFLNTAAVQRGLFNGLFFDYALSYLNAGEYFQMPERDMIIDRRSDLIFDNLEGGVARVGSIVRRNYVLISKYADAQVDGSQRRFTDRSEVYMGRSPARIVSVTRARDHSGRDFIRVFYCQIKHAIAGDKGSSRTGNKGIIARLFRASDFPYTESGLIPDIIVNPQSIPTRRALNQLIETVCGRTAARIGCFINATTSTPIDLDKLLEIMREHGDRNMGYDRMYNGRTGDWLAPMFVGIATYQRLQKFVDAECRALYSGKLSKIEHQPIRAGVDKGSLRLGEMENWTIAGHGAMRSFAEKILSSSDGTTVYICARCGQRAIYNSDRNIYRCDICGERARITMVPTAWSSIVAMDEIRTLGVRTQIELEPHKFYAE